MPEKFRDDKVYTAASKTPRVRIAPSPTGNLHVGTARAALFNELFARHEGGSFIVRIEDTDKERSKPEYEKAILEGLTWLGMSWDEGPMIDGSEVGEYGPYHQSKRLELHTAALEKLLNTGAASRGEGETIVLNVEPQEVVFEDAVRGTVKVHTDSFGGSFIIARSLTNPLFHLAVVVDDATMEITHVIRGEDHLHNTVKHILLQRALGYEIPTYAHLPLLLDEKRAKLSKRKNETNVLAYRERGYLPQTMINYLALLGWNPKNDEEFFTHDELVEKFTLEGVQKAGAIFSEQKLNAMNKAYLMKLSGEELLAWGVYHYNQNDIAITDEQKLLAALKTELGRFSSYDIDGAPLHMALAWHATAPATEDIAKHIIWKKSDTATTTDRLMKLVGKITAISETDFTAEKLQEEIMNWIDTDNLGRGETLWPMRVSLSGREHSPGPFEIASVIGKDETIARLESALATAKNL